VVGLVGVAVATVVAGSVVVDVVVATRRVVAVMPVDAVVVEDREGAVPGGPGPPERGVIGPLPDVVTIVAHPTDRVVAVVTAVAGTPVVGVGALDDAPVCRDVRDGVRVVVPVVVAALVQVGVADEVVHAVNLVDEVLVGVEVVVVDVQVLLVTPGAGCVGARVGALVLVHNDGAVSLGRAGHCEDRREDTERSDECGGVDWSSCHWVLATFVG
jgi:hypothetical protein